KKYFLGAVAISPSSVIGSSPTSHLPPPPESGGTLPFAFDQLDSVAEGIAELEAAEAVHPVAVFDFAACGFELAFPGVELGDFVGDVRARGGAVDAGRFDADVELAVAGLHPQAAARAQERRLLDLGHAEQVA